MVDDVDLGCGEIEFVELATLIALDISCLHFGGEIDEEAVG